MDYKNITIIQDSREKISHHDTIEKPLKEKGIKLLRSKLPFGDYALLNDYSLVVDFKQDVMEVASNLTHEHIRFRNEITNANTFGIGIIILIEETIQYNNLDDVALRYQIPKWKSNSFQMVDGKKVCRHRKGEPMGKFNVSALVKAMKTMQEKYAVIFAFTTPDKCGETIIDILINKREILNKYFNKKIKELKKD